MVSILSRYDGGHPPKHRLIYFQDGLSVSFLYWERETYFLPHSIDWEMRFFFDM